MVKTRLLGLLGVIGIIAFLIGVPAALIAMTGSPIPHTWPTVVEVTHALTHPDDGTLLLGLLRVVVWVGWLYFAVSLLREIVAQIRGLRAPSLPTVTGKQRLAAGLVSTAALLFVGAPLASAAPAGAVAPHAVTASWDHSQTIGQQPGAGHHDDRGHAAGQARGDYVVESGDTLWEISERKLGEGDRYPRLFHASEDTLQADGNRLTDPDHIEPGWRITIPGKAAKPAAAMPRPDDGSGPSTRVQQQSVTPQGDGGAGPTTHDGGTSGLSREQQPTQQAVPPTSRSAPIPEQTVEVATPTPTATATPETAPPAVAAAPLSTAHPAAVTEPGSLEEDEGFPLRTLAGVGALLAAGFIALVATRRMMQRRRRRPGQNLPMPEGPAAATEAELAAVADPFSVELVDRALRTLAAGCEREHRPLPQLRAARLTHDILDLYLAEPAQLPAPWTGTVDAAVWTLSAESAGLLEATTAKDVPAPYPSLVTIGQDSEGGHVLLDLEHVASLGILGDEAASLEVLTALAVELATSRWADDVQVTVVGALPELEDCFQTGRVRYVPTPALLINELTTRIHADGAALQDAGMDLNTARPAGALTGLWTPEIVLVAQPLTDDQRSLLAEALQTHPRAAVAAVTAGDALSPWAVNLTSEPPTLEPLDLAVTPQRVDTATYQGLIQVAAIANEDPTPTALEASASPEIPLQDLPVCDDRSQDRPAATATDDGVAAAPAAADESVVDLSASTTDPSVAEADVTTDGGSDPTAPLIRVLGPVDVTGTTGPIEATKRGVCTEIAAFIALMPQPTPANLDQSLWPPHPDRPDRSPEQIGKGRRESMSKLRRWLGANPAGDMWLPAADGQYAFLPGVTTDWHRFQEHIAAGLQQTSDEELHAALGLVRGQPFTRPTSKRSRRYCWAEHLQQQMITAITDTAYELAQRHLAAGRWRDAARAAAVGTSVDAVCQPLWRLRLKAAHCAGATQETDDIIKRITTDSAAYGDGDLEEETAALIEAIRSGERQRVS